MRERVAIVTRLYGLGGVEKHVTNLAQALTSRGTEVVLVARFLASDDRLRRQVYCSFDEVLANQIAPNRAAFRIGSAILFLRILVRIRSFDSIYVLEYGGFVRLLMKFASRRTKLIVNRVGLPLTFRQASAQVDKRVDVVVVESETHALAFRALRGHLAVEVLPHLWTRVQLPSYIESDVVRVAHLGRLDEMKGVSELLSIWSGLGLSNAQLTFFGCGPAYDALSRAALAFGDSVALVPGWETAEELGNILRKTDIVALYSASEGLPLTLLEAMDAGVAIVATDVGAIRELSAPELGVVVVARDPSAFSAALAELVSRVKKHEINRRLIRRHLRRLFDYISIEESWCRILSNQHR